MPIGIRNIGMTCYIDSLAQALIVCPKLSTSIENIIFFKHLLNRNIHEARNYLIDKNLVQKDMPADSCEVLMNILPNKCSATGALSYLHRCNECNDIITRNDITNIFIVPRKSTTVISVSNIFSESIIDNIECEKCKKRTSHTIVKAGFIPQTLIIGLTGYDRSFIADSGVKIYGSGFSGTKILKALISHNNSHYVAFVLERDYWFKCDGENITKVSYDTIPFHESTLLFYE